MGDKERFTALYAAHVTAVLGFVARRCNTPADAADVTADVFVVAWRRIADVPVGNRARLWLYGVARRALANHRRGETRRSRLGQALLDAWTGASAPDPAELFAVREQAVVVRSALAALRPIDADLLTLTAWEGLSVAQAADVVGIRPEAARARISRARRRIRQLRGEPEEPALQANSPSSIAVEGQS